MSTLADRLRGLRGTKGLTQEDISKMLGVSRATYANWETDRTEPDSETLRRIADLFDVSIDYLTGRTDAPHADPPLSSASGRGIRIPVLGRVQAGIPIEAVQDILDYEEITPELASQGQHFALIIRGESMAPRVREGDVVIVRKQDHIENGEYAVVMVNGEDATVKRFFCTEQGVKLVPLNPAFEALFFTADEVERLPVVIIGKVVELRGKL